MVDKQLVDLMRKAAEKGENFSVTDEQFAELIDFKEKPNSDVGLAVMKRIIKTIEQHYNKPAPVRVKAFEKQFPEKKVEVWLFSDSGRLCSQGIFDRIYVMKGNIYSASFSREDEPIRTNGVLVCSLLESFAALVASRMETASTEYEVINMDVVKTLDQANLTMPGFLKFFMQKNNKETHINSLVNANAEVIVT